MQCIKYFSFLWMASSFHFFSILSCFFVFVFVFILQRAFVFFIYFIEIFIAVAGKLSGLVLKLFL